MKIEDNVVAMANIAEDGTMIITSVAEAKATQLMEQALSTFDPANKQYTAYLNFNETPGTLTQETLATYAEKAQTDLDTVKAINAVIRKYINMSDIIGMVVQTIINNINTEYRLSYDDFGTQRNKSKTLRKVKELIDDFNRQIDIERLIAEAIEMTYCEGTYVCLLQNKDSNWTYTYIPLGIAEMSGYNVNGEPVVLISMDELKTALDKTMLKNKKREALFFNTVQEEIEANYPKEVLDAYNSKDTYAVLDVNYTGVVRINARGRKYGVSPLFRVLSPMLTLEAFQNADTASAKSKAKKIIHQILRKEVMGSDGQRKGLDIMAYAHQEFMKAFSNSTVAYTSPAAVEKITYVEPGASDVSDDKIEVYRKRVLESLGVSFLTGDGVTSASIANISLKQLMKQVNAISRQVEHMLRGFYRTVLTVNGYDLMYLPDIKIIDSEMMEESMKMDLAGLLYNTFACSRETCLDVLGLDLEDEKAKREAENEDDLSSIFTPYPTSYNTSGDSDGEAGRPEGTDLETEEKRLNDGARNELTE